MSRSEQVTAAGVAGHPEFTLCNVPSDLVETLRSIHASSDGLETEIRAGRQLTADGESLSGRLECFTLIGFPPDEQRYPCLSRYDSFTCLFAGSKTGVADAAASSGTREWLVYPASAWTEAPLKLPSYHKSVIVLPPPGHRQRALLLAREAPSETDSGWFSSGAMPRNHDHQQRHDLQPSGSLYEARSSVTPGSVPVRCGSQQVATSGSGSGLPWVRSGRPQFLISRARVVCRTPRRLGPCWPREATRSR
jgi:hypothetical protein